MSNKFKCNQNSKILFIIALFLFNTFIFPQDSLIVVNLYHSTNGDNWINNDNWLSSKPLKEWYGLTVNDTNVIGIELSFNHLSGKIPNEIGKLSSLKILDFSKNNLYGSLPDSISHIDNLEVLDLSNNKLTGSIDQLIGSNSNLLILNLSNNNFRGEIPSSINRFINLETLNISNNSFTGKIPNNLFTLQKLSRLDLQKNKFNGEIPRQIGNLIRLEFLDLSRNNFSGSIPKEIGKLINLKDRLALNHNELSGIVPKELCALKKLEYVWLNNNQLSGILPFEIGKLISLKSLFIYQNNLTGPLPQSLGNLRDLEILYLQNNSFGGGIPNEIWFLPKLKMLKMENNKFTGSIPGDLRILKSIQSIDISNNNIETITDTVSLPNSMLSYNITNNRLFCNQAIENKIYNIAFQNNDFNKVIGLDKQKCTGDDWKSFKIETHTIDFDYVQTDSSAQRTFWIMNTNSRTNILQMQNFDKNNFIIPDSMITIEQDDTVFVTIIYSPIMEDINNDVILIEDIINKQTEYITISGEGIEAALPDRDKTIPWRMRLQPITISDSLEAIINYDVPKPTNVNITIYNLGGKPIKTLVNGNVDIGYQEIIWDCINEEGTKVDSGEYLCVMQSGMFIQIQHLLIIY